MQLRSSTCFDTLYKSLYFYTSMRTIAREILTSRTSDLHERGARNAVTLLFIVIEINPNGEIDSSATSVFNALSLLVVFKSLDVFVALVKLALLPGVAN